LEHIFNGDFLDGVPQIFDGNVTVLGLTLNDRQDGVAKQIACLNDVSDSSSYSWPSPAHDVLHYP
jgi:hypothetical protein